MGGIAAAIGGLAQGIGQGLKLRSELDDAESKRKYMGLQSERLQQEVDTEKKFGELQEAMSQEIQNYAQGKGVYAPAEGQAYDPLNQQTVDMYYNRLGSMAVQQGILAKKNPAEIEQTYNALRKDKVNERVIQASQLLSMGEASGLDLIKPQFKMMFGGELKNATYDDKSDSFNISYINKDGVEGNRTIKRQAFSEGLLPMALNPADATKFVMQNKELEQQRVLKERELTGMEDWRKVQERLQGRELDIKTRDVAAKEKGLNIEKSKVDGLLTYYDRLGQAALKNADTTAGSVGMQREARVLSDQLDSVVTLLGIDRKFDENKHDPEQIAAHEAKRLDANSAMYLIKNGIKDGKLTIDAPTAIRMTQEANNAEFKDIKRMGKGMFAVEVNGMNVPISLTEAEYKKLDELNAKNKDPDNPVRRNGINTPEPKGSNWGNSGFGLYR